MHQSRLDECFKLLSQRCVCSLGDRFNSAIWKKIWDRNQVALNRGFDGSVLHLSSRTWTVAALVTTFIAVPTVVWIAVTGLKSVSRGVGLVVTGEVVDLACYFQDGASGAEHAACARRCIASGLPAGLKTGSGKTYLLLSPANRTQQDSTPYEAVSQQWAGYAGMVIRIRGEVSEKDGVSAIANAQVLK